MRVIQPAGSRGSLKWIQLLTSQYPHVLESAIRAEGGLDSDESIEWVSPRPDDDWAEYRDGLFLERVGLAHLQPQLANFWPSRGPQWDALGVSSRSKVVLVEAKAHLNELASYCGAGSPRSMTLIEDALDRTKESLGVDISSNWLDGYYQYANRLAHLRFLQEQGVVAKLVFVYFLNDPEMGGPRSQEEWENGLNDVYRYLGLSMETRIPGVLNAYIDTAVLAEDTPMNLVGMPSRCGSSNGTPAHRHAYL